MKITVIIILFLLSILNSNKSYAQLPVDILNKAEAGDADAQLFIANIYQEGRGVEKNYTQAAYWLRKAGLKGSLRAETELGHLFEEGLGVPKSDLVAIEWYRKAALKGDAIAQYNLGLFYATGRGGGRDAAKAAIWYRRAAEQGIADAALNLAALYSDGEGVPQNHVLEYALVLIAADHRVSVAEKRLHEFERWKRILSSSQMGEASNIAGTWKQGAPLPEQTTTGTGVPFVTVENEQTLRVTGKIKKGSFSLLKKMFNNNIKNIILNSEGGDAFEGIKIADFIVKNNINVIVDGQCMSACANYIFIFGNKKIIKNNSIVCFHGGVPKDRSSYRNLIYANKLNDHEEMADKYWNNVSKFSRKQYFLLDKKGINPSIMDYDISVEIPADIPAFAGYSGGMTLDKYLEGKQVFWCPNQYDLSNLGIFVDEMWYPQDFYDLFSLGQKYNSSLVLATNKIDKNK